MTQNVVQGLLYGDSLYGISAAIPWTMIFLFFVPIVAALFYGRVFCSSACPLGAVQELTAIFPVKLPDWVDQSFGLIRYVYLGVAVLFVALGMQFLLCRFDPYVNFFRLSGIANILWFGGALLVIGIFIARPYCRFLCPYGAILGLCSKTAMINVKVTPGECTNCRLCEKMCPYGAIRSPTKQPDAKERFRGPLRLVVVICAIPLILMLSLILCRQTTMWFAMFHPDIAIVPILRMEDPDQLGLVTVTGSFDETLAFKKIGGSHEEQYEKAARLYGKFLAGTSLLGLWIGLVVSLKLITVSLRRKRTEYEVDPSKCMACGRCFWYCPNQKENRVLLEDKIRFFR